MAKQLMEWSFVLHGLVPDSIHLKRKAWLKPGEILVEHKNGKMMAFVLAEEEELPRPAEKIITYLWFSSLISTNRPHLESLGGTLIPSKEKLGKGRQFNLTFTRAPLPDDIREDIEAHAHKYVSFLGRLHNKYAHTISENQFMATALEYFFDAEQKFVYNDEGFVSAIVSLEALFNEGPSDIKYKLALRAAFLLGLTGVSATIAFQKLKIFYNRRSNLVHGGVVATHDPDQHLVSSYTRKAIICFLILLDNEHRRSFAKNQRKNKIIEELDLAILDADRQRDLKKELLKGLKEFRLPVPRTFERTDDNGHYRTTAW